MRSGEEVLGRTAICGAGFIGGNLIRRLARDGATIRVLDRNAPPPEFADRVEWIQGEFSDVDALRRALRGCTVAYHLVSSTVPGDRDIDVARELAENIMSTVRFVEVCLDLGVRRIVFVSSSSVYGEQARTPVPESASTDPISSHGINKLATEKYLLLYRFNHGIEVRIVRLSNPYGPGQDPQGRQGFVAIALGKLMAGHPLLLRGNGDPVRDFIFIDDVCDALILAGRASEAPAVLNIGTGRGHSLREVVSVIEEAAGEKVALTGGPLRKSDIAESVLDIAQARAALGFDPRVSLRDGIARTLHHYGLR